MLAGRSSKGQLDRSAAGPVPNEDAAPKSRR